LGLKLKKIAISSVAILAITIFLLFAHYNSTIKEVIDKFKAQQLYTTKLLSKEIESCLHDESHAIEVFSSFAELKSKDKRAIATSVEEYFRYSKKDHVKSVSVYNENRALNRANQAFNLILESAGVGIFGLDLNGNHTFVNPMAAGLLGYNNVAPYPTERRTLSRFGVLYLCNAK
jgi:PAS domain-containing protein